MRSLQAKAFDLYGRYSHVWRIRREAMPDVALRILDIGDPFGTISGLFPDDFTVSLDIYSDNPAQDGHQHIEGTGFALPFTDGSFDLVCSHDVLEHLPAPRRTEFLTELMRVSRGPVVVVAPWADPRSTRAEHIVNSYFVARLGHAIPALNEHDEETLPDGDAIRHWLDRSGIAYAEFADGWTYHWVALYYVRAHLSASGNNAAISRLDYICNQLLTEADHQPPHYRTTLVLRPPATMPSLPAPVRASAADQLADVESLTELAYSLGEALVGDEDPFAAGSRLRSWADGLRDDPLPGRRQLAASFDVIFTTFADESFEEPPAEAATAPPLGVAAVVVHRGGVDALRETLASLVAQDYPKPAFDVIVVDVGAPNEAAGVAAGFPGVSVLTQPSGTADEAAVTAAVHSTDREVIALIGHGCAARPDWLRALTAALRHTPGAVSVAGGVERADGTLATPPAGGARLFAPRQSMLVTRHAYVLTEGFDPEFAGSGADADFGWRLWTRGFAVTSADAIVRAPGDAEVTRSAGLRALVKNAGDAYLARALGPELLALAARAAEMSDASVLQPAQRLVASLDAAFAARERVQAARVRSDDEIAAVVGAPFGVSDDPAALDLHRRLRAGLGLAGEATEGPGRVLCVSTAPLSEKVDATRPLAIAAALAGGFDVALAAPGDLDQSLGGLSVLAFPDAPTLVRLAAAWDVVVAPADAFNFAPALRDAGSVLVVDLGAPWGGPDASAALEAGDFFVCASERQRDYWLGMLSARGGVDAARTTADPTLRMLIDVVADGVPDVPPYPKATVLRDATRPPSERSIVWVGSDDLSTYDPTLAVEAFAVAGARGVDARLSFVGVNPAFGDVVVRRAEQLGLVDRVVVLPEVGDELRESWLLEADVAITAVRDDAGARFAARRDVLDCLWAGLPVVTNGRDAASELVRDANAGVVAPAGDAAAAGNALANLLTDIAKRTAMANNGRAAAQRLTWGASVEPLRNVAGAPWRWRAIRAARARGRVVTTEVEQLLDQRDREINRLRREGLDEAAALRQRVSELEAIIRHKDRPYALLRKVPGVTAISRTLRDDRS